MAYDSYSLSEDFLSPDPVVANQFLDSENLIFTPPSTGTSNDSSPDSLQQQMTIEGLLSTDYLLPPNDGDDTCPEHNSDENVSPNVNILSSISHSENNDRLRIIAQPAEISRIRYATDSIKKKDQVQGHRFIRTDPKESKYEYPTVQFSRKYCDPKRELYIKATPVTIKTDRIPEHYIHPYKIGSEGNYLTDDDTNSLYFPIQNDEFNTCEKKLQITQAVTLQKHLKTPRPLCEHRAGFRELRKLSLDNVRSSYSKVIHSDLSGNQHNRNILNPKEIIATYQLNKFQFIFAIAEKTTNSTIPVSIPDTEIPSRIVTREVLNKNPGKHTNPAATSRIKCIPRMALWEDGGEVAIIMPHSIDNKTYSIRFDFPSNKEEVVNDVTPIDRKTFSFFAPRCPITDGDRELTVPMIINENGKDLDPIKFMYIRRTFRQIRDSNKRTRDEYTGTDAVVVNNTDISSVMNNLTLDENKSEPSTVSQTRAPATTSKSTVDDTSAKFDKFIDQLQEALGAFVRTNDPSKFFRKHRSLLTSSGENSPPLHDAIEHGYISIVSTIIQQVADIREPNHLLEEKNKNGETVLLAAARCNEWKVIELIVKKRKDMIEAKDNNANNMLHLLASVKEDASAETLKNLFEILPLDVKMRLLKEANKKNEIAKDIAQSQGNTQCLSLLSTRKNLDETNN